MLTQLLNKKYIKSTKPLLDRFCAFIIVMLTLIYYNKENESYLANRHQLKLFQE